MQLLQQCTLGLVLAVVDGHWGSQELEGAGPYEGDGLPAQGGLGVVHLAYRCLHWHAAALGNVGLHARPFHHFSVRSSKAWQAAVPLARREVPFAYYKRLHCWWYLRGSSPGQVTG